MNHARLNLEHCSLRCFLTKGKFYKNPVVWDNSNVHVHHRHALTISLRVLAIQSPMQGLNSICAFVAELVAVLIVKLTCSQMQGSATMQQYMYAVSFSGNVSLMGEAQRKPCGTQRSQPQKNATDFCNFQVMLGKCTN